MIDQHLAGTQLIPPEIGVRLAGGEEEPVLLIDLGEVDRRRLLALLEGGQPLGERGLGHLGGTSHQRIDGGFASWGDGVAGLQPLGGQKAPGHGRDQRAVESGEAGELDMDRCHQQSSTYPLQIAEN